jgi:hypothetical protein
VRERTYIITLEPKLNNVFNGEVEGFENTYSNCVCLKFKEIVSRQSELFVVQKVFCIITQHTYFPLYTEIMSAIVYNLRSEREEFSFQIYQKGDSMI